MEFTELRNYYELTETPNTKEKEAFYEPINLIKERLPKVYSIDEYLHYRGKGAQFGRSPREPDMKPEAKK